MSEEPQLYTYTTKREIMMKRQAFLIQTIEEAQNALSGLMSGDISSYNLGSWSVSRSRPDLDKLAKWIKNAMLELDEIAAILSGRPARHTSTCVYTNPQQIGWWRLP